ncbi:putative kinesin [Trypanosoma conorhini]|uniref:Putative kinesin n=1 Tax=Trypanosoma conorhini TaxID=83891 RepID=A0A422N5Y9_9TRYP|nr:putative kinesin [Trypanosoma conorhini]RNF00897.1 putative kinesin [Trypanosoma conorhini]
MDAAPRARGTAASSSVCSDLRELNEAKVANILSYLDEAVATRPQLAVSFAPHDDMLPEAYAPGGAALAPSTALNQSSHKKPPCAAPPQQQQQQQLSSSASAACLTSYVIGGSLDPYVGVYHGIKAKIEALRFSNDELRAENEELKARLGTARQREAEHVEKLQFANRAETQLLRDGFRESEAEHRRLTQGLQREKAQLTKAVESLTTQLRQEMSRREEEVAKLESANAAAIAQLKMRWQAQEKAAREKWRVAEAKRIKESTLQSLEPDIVLLLNRHKAEKARMREEFENELRQRDEVIAAKEATVDEVKARLARDAEATMTREQNEFRERLREEVERVNRQLEEERRAARQKTEDMEAFFEEQKGVMQREIARLQKELFALKEAASTAQATFHDAVAKEVAGITANSNNIVGELKEKLMWEFSRREKETQVHNKHYLAAKEEELRRKCEAERDAAVAAATQRLEQTHVKYLTESQGNDGLLRDRFAQMSRENERLRVEAELLQEQLKSALDAKNRKDEEIGRLREAAELTEQRVKAIEDGVRGECETRMHVLDTEWQRKLRQFEIKHVEEVGAMQHELEKASIELEAARNAAALEQNSIEQKHAAELTSINERVLVALATKDNTLKAQTEQISLLQEALRHRDEHIARHRELL